MDKQVLSIYLRMERWALGNVKGYVKVQTWFWRNVCRESGSNRSSLQFDLEERLANSLRKCKTRQTLPFVARWSSFRRSTALSQISVKLINHEIDEPSFPSKTSFRKHNLSPRWDKGSLNLYLTVLQVNLQPKGRGKNILKINCRKRGERHVLVLPPSRTGGIVFYRRNIGELKPAYRGIGSNCQRKQALLLRSNFKVGWTRLRAAYSWKKGKKLSSI